MLNELMALHVSIHERQELHKKNKSELEHLVTRLTNDINGLGNAVSHEAAQTISRRRSDLEKTVIELERDIIREDTDAFRDLNDLRKELSQIMLNYNAVAGAYLR
jgi:gas vesicle protein